MKKRNKIYLTVLGLQCIILLSIVFFPERIKIDKFTDYTPLGKPVATVDYNSVPPNDIRRKIADSNLFTRYNGTRGITTNDRKSAVIILTNNKLEQSLHFDRLMIEYYNRGVGSLLIDLSDAPFYVPIIRSDGGYYTTEERQGILLKEMIEYLKDIGYKSFSLLTFGEWFNFVNKTTVGIEEIDSLVFISNKHYENIRETLPPTLIIIEQFNASLEENRQFYNSLKNKTIESDYLLLEETYYQLSDINGKVNKLVEKVIFDKILNWTTSFFHT